MIVICVAVVFAGWPHSRQADAATRLLTLEEAYQMALKVSESIRDAELQVGKRETELKQAREAVRHQGVKDLSLFAKPHSLPKDIELGMKIPTAEKQLKEAKRELALKQSELHLKTELAYLQIYQLQSARDAAARRLQTALDKQREWEIKQRFGLAKQEEVDSFREEAEQARSAWKQAALAYKSATIEFGSRIGLNLENVEVKLEVKTEYAVLDQSVALQLLSHTLQNDVTVYKMTENRKLAEYQVDLIRNLFKSKFARGHTAGIEALYASGNVNEELLKVNNDILLQKAKKDWEGWILIPAPIIIVLPLPLVLFQGEFDGLRYFDDQRYALLIAQTDVEKAKAQENEARAAAADKAKTSYLSAKAAEEAYAQALKALDKAQKTREVVQTKIRAGIAKTAELELADAAIAEAEAVKTGAYIQYITALAQLNFDTSGGLKRYMRSGVLPWQSIDDGLGPLNSGQAEQPDPQLWKGSWRLQADADGWIGKFTVVPEGASTFTSFSLHLPNGMMIDKPAAAGESLAHLHFLFQDLSAFRIDLYDADGRVVAEAQAVGNGEQGPLQIKRLAEPMAAESTPLDATDAWAIIGSYQIHRHALDAANIAAANKSSSDSGQGSYYRSEFADGTWFRLDDAGEYVDIVDPKRKTAADRGEIEALHLVVRIEADGTVVPLLSPSEIDKKLEQLKEQKGKLEQEKEEAVNAADGASIASLTTELKEIAAEMELYAALREEDSSRAVSAMSKINNPQAMIAELQEEGKQLQQQVLQDQWADLQEQIAEAEQNGDQEKAEQLKDQAANLQDELTDLDNGQAQDPLEEAISAANLALEQLKHALDDNDETEVASAIHDLVTSFAAADRLQSGLSERLAAAQEAADILQMQHDEALHSGDSARAEKLKEAIAQQQAMLSDLLQEAEWMRKDAAQEQLDAVMARSDTYQALSAAMAETVVNVIQGQIAEAITNVQALEAAKYTAEELALLAKWGEQAEATHPDVVALPVESLIARDMHLHLAVPPLLIQGDVYAPIREIAEALGATVIWQEDTKTAVIVSGDTVIIFTIDALQALVNGAAVPLHTPARLINGKTVAPLRLVVEQLGGTMNWDERSGIVEIFRQSK